MKFHTSTYPAVEAAAHITRCLNSASKGVLCLLAGGSAFDIYPKLTLSTDAKVRTIFMLGDERWSRDDGVNNYQQLRSVLQDNQQDYQIINTSVEPNENHVAYTARLNEKISGALQSLTKAFRTTSVLSINGIGADGHTSGIMPLEKSVFDSIYVSQDTFVPITKALEGNFNRSTITPSWIANHVDECIVYAAGIAKQSILESIKNESKPIHEMPAQILRKHKLCTVYTDQTVSDNTTVDIVKD